MGYMRLRALLKHKEGSLKEAAAKVGIPVTRMYNLTGKFVPFLENPSTFTRAERRRIMEVYFADGRLTEEEVFENYEDPGELGTRPIYPYPKRGGY